MKYQDTSKRSPHDNVAPARERGLKYPLFAKRSAVPNGRSRKGAWIEMSAAYNAQLSNVVAPARERGLK